MWSPVGSERSRRLRRERSGLLVVDFQEKLLPAIDGGREVVERAALVVRGARLLGVPLWVTEQYVKGLGPTVELLAGWLEGVRRFQKTAFSAMGAAGLPEAIQESGVRDVVLVGIETHVCVCQTALDLLEAGYGVVVAADAVSSRRTRDRELGLARMQSEGARLGSAEMILFEWLERAGTDEFRQVLSWVK